MVGGDPAFWKHWGIPHPHGFVGHSPHESPWQLMWVGVTCLWLSQAGLMLQWCLCPHGAPGSCPVARTLQQPHPHRSLPSVLHVSSPKWFFRSKSKWGKPCPFGSAGRATGPHSFGGHQLPHGFERGHLTCWNPGNGPTLGTEEAALMTSESPLGVLLPSSWRILHIHSQITLSSHPVKPKKSYNCLIPSCLLPVQFKLAVFLWRGWWNLWFTPMLTSLSESLDHTLFSVLCSLFSVLSHFFHLDKLRIFHVFKFCFPPD